MVKIYNKKLPDKPIYGTIIDFETIGDFRNEFNDSRRYQDIIPTVFGFLEGSTIKIFCAKSIKSLENLKTIIRDTIPKLKRPFYAFNSNFERSILFHYLGLNILFLELNNEQMESKKDARRSLGIPNYGDPFFDRGKLCIQAWHKGELDKVILHNRSCLLKERDILLKRGFRSPDPIILRKI